MTCSSASINFVYHVNWFKHCYMSYRIDTNWYKHCYMSYRIDKNWLKHCYMSYRIENNWLKHCYLYKIFFLSCMTCSSASINFVYHVWHVTVFESVFVYPVWHITVVESVVVYPIWHVTVALLHAKQDKQQLIQTLLHVI
jgi:hypothetical protein